MLCKQCKKFFSVTDTQAGSEVVCPHCQTAQTAEQTPITCRCSNCNQKLKVEMWMEGEQVQCPSCQQERKLVDVCGHAVGELRVVDDGLSRGYPAEVEEEEMEQ